MQKKTTVQTILSMILQKFTVLHFRFDEPQVKRNLILNTKNYIRKLSHKF